MAGDPKLRVLELYCGIGGCAAALAPPDGAGSKSEPGAEVVAAIDVNHLAVGVYRANFPHPAEVRNLESLGTDELAAYGADLWWLSPPCQPFTRRGLGRDLDDTRTASLLALIGRAVQVRPRWLALENVPGFAGSRTHARLTGALGEAGYSIRERLLCPTELGVPNRRRRFYLVADRIAPSHPRPLSPPTPINRPLRPLADYLDGEPSPDLAIDPALLDGYAGALDLVDAADPGAVTACFTAAYGRSPVRSGSYLIVDRDSRGRPRTVRRFSPGEVLHLLGFPSWYRLPPELPAAAGWRLAGNSLSVDAVRAVVAAALALSL